MEVIAFFDLFDYPATAIELWRYGSAACALPEIIAAADGLARSGRLETAAGFYFLPGRAETIATRLQRYNYTERKFKRALRAARLFKVIPWIRLIAVGNLIGADNLKDGSDIDLFIVTEPRRLWLARLAAVGLAEAMGWRPRPGAERDRICLSFFKSEDGLDLSGLKLPARESESALLNKVASFSLGAPPYRAADAAAERVPEETEDIYFDFWLAGLTPIYDAGGVYEKIIRANRWLFNRFPNWTAIEPTSRRRVPPRRSRFYRDAIDLFVGGLEPNVKKFQLKRMPEYLARPLNKDTRVTANDRIIKLHANDRREEYRTKYTEKLKGA